MSTESAWKHNPFSSKWRSELVQINAYFEMKKWSSLKRSSCEHTAKRRWTHFLPEPHLDVVLMEELHPPQQKAVALHVHDLCKWVNVCVCVFVFRSVLIVKTNRMLHTFLMFFYCVIYSAEPCWGEFCRKAAARPWWPWWSCRQSFPVVEPRRRSATRLLCVQRGKAQSIVKLINVRRTQNFCLS